MAREGLIAAIRHIGAAIARDCLVVGAGGMSLSLQDIREQTLNINYTVECSNMPKLTEALKMAGMMDLKVFGASPQDVDDAL